MNPSLAIHIPEPCHEDWNKMTPKDNGSYCGSCEKTVVDFSKMNDDQIAQYVLAHPNEKMCGRFANAQLDRSLAISKSQNITALKAFVYILFMVFGASLFSYTYVKNNEDRMRAEIGTEQNEVRVVGAMEIRPPYDIAEVADTAAADTTAIETETQMMTAGTMMVDIMDSIETPSEFTIVPEKAIYPENTTMGGMMVRTDFTDNRIQNFFPDDTTSLEKKDSVSKEIVDQVKLPTLETYPNPTSGNVNIKYNIPVRTDVLIELYDINGNKVKDLVSTSQLYEGTYIYPADLSELSNGTYICKMIAGERSFSTKIVVEK